MAICVLLNSNDPWFEFEHVNAHRVYLGAMAPLTRFSILPYLLDPEIQVGQSASIWHLNHQVAHNDALATLPTFYRYSFIEIEEPARGLFMGPSVVDTNLDDASQRTWWTFVNHTEHIMANDALLPVTGSTLYQFPFS